MIPKPPPREGTLGFLFMPPYRVQGFSMAGEATALHIPELDLCFDMGLCPRPSLAAKFCAITHGHMDHIGALAYWCSQRNFQGMGPGTIVCDARIENDIRGMMRGFVDLERQNTPYELVALENDGQLEIKNNTFLRAFHTDHTCPSIGYAVVEKRTKLREEFVGMPQEKLRELKDRGTEITRSFEVPLIAFTGDTLPGAHLVREDVRAAKIVIAECTFFEPDHKSRAVIGKHLHVDDIAEWSRVLEAEDVVLVHTSRRTHVSYARKRLDELLGREQSGRFHLLMDHRANRLRYDAQAEEAERRERELAQRS